MTLHLNLPTSHLGRDTLALIDLVNDLRGCNSRLDDILNQMPPMQTMSPMGADADGVSRGLLAADDRATYVILLDACWTLNLLIQPRTGTNTTEVRGAFATPARQRRQFGPTLGQMQVAA